MTPTPANEVRKQYQRGIRPASAQRRTGRPLEVEECFACGSLTVRDGQGYTDQLWKAGEYEVVEWSS